MSHQGREAQPHEDVGGDRCRPPRPKKKKKTTTKAVATNTTRTAATASLSCCSTPDSAGTTTTTAASAAAAAAAMPPPTVLRIPAEAAEWMSSAFGLDVDLCSAPSSWHYMSVKQLREIYDALYEFDAVRNKRRPLRKRATKPVLIHEIQSCFYRMDVDDDYGDDDCAVVDGAVLQALRLGATNQHGHLEQQQQQQQQQKPQSQPVGSTKKLAATDTTGRTPAAPAAIPAAVPPSHRAPPAAAAPKAKAPPPGSDHRKAPAAVGAAAPASSKAPKRSDPRPAPPKQAQHVDRRDTEQSPRSPPSDGFFSPAAATPASLGRKAAPRPGFGQQASSPSPIWFTPAPAPNARPAPSPFGSHPPGTGLGVGTAPSGPLFGSSSSSFPFAAPTTTTATAAPAAAPAAAAAAASPNSPRRRGVRATVPLPKEPPPSSASFGAPLVFSFPPAAQGSNPFQGGASGSLFSTLSSAPPQAPNGAAPHPPTFTAFGTLGGNPPLDFGAIVRRGPAAGAASNRTGQAPPAAFHQQSSLASGSAASAGANSASVPGANSSNNPGPAAAERPTGATGSAANAASARTNPDTTPQNPKEMALLAELMPLGFRNPAEVLVSIRKLVSAKGEEQVTPDDVLCDVVQTREEAEFARQMDQARLASERDRRTDAEVRRKANALALDEKLLTACAADWIERKDMFRDSWLLKSSCGDSLLSHVTERPTELKRHLVEILKLEKKSRQWYGQELPSYFFDGVLAEKLRVIKDGVALEVALKREMADLRDGLLLLSNQDGNVPLVFLEAKEEWKRRYGGDDDGSDDDVILLETRRPSDSQQRVETIETS